MEKAGSRGRVRAVAMREAGPGTTMASVYGVSRRGRWQIASTGWWPRPRKVLSGGQNAEWELRRCEECGDWEACLNTVSGVNEGEELTVGDDHCILGGQGAEWPIEMTFDGGAREINGRRVAGAGAILWKSDGETGRMRMIRSKNVVVIIIRQKDMRMINHNTR